MNPARIAQPDHVQLIWVCSLGKTSAAGSAGCLSTDCYRAMLCLVHCRRSLFSMLPTNPRHVQSTWLAACSNRGQQISELHGRRH